MRREKIDEIEYYINEFKTIKKELLDSKDHFINVEKYNCTLNNGIVIPREKIVKGRRDGSAAIILPVTNDNETLLVVQPRVFTRSGVGVELPAGYVDGGEKPVDAAMRELREETGFVTNDMIHLASYYQDQGCSAAFNHAFLARNCEKREDQHLDNDEFIKYFTCYYDEMLELEKMGYINDANSLIAIEKSKKYILK